MLIAYYQIDDTSSLDSSGSISRTKKSFGIELSGNQQKQYGKQFAGAPTPSEYIEYKMIIENGLLG